MKTICAWCGNIITPDDGQGGLDIFGTCPTCASQSSFQWPPAASSLHLPRVPASRRPRVSNPPPGGWTLFVWSVLLAGCVGFWYLVFLAAARLWDWAVGT